MSRKTTKLATEAIPDGGAPNVDYPAFAGKLSERGFQAGNYDNGIERDTDTYEVYIDAIQTHNVDLIEVQEGDEPFSLTAEDVEITVLNPPVNESNDNVHYNSVTLVIDYGEFRYLTTGDVETDAEQRMVDQLAPELEADVYQVSHHGSHTSSTAQFLEEVDPEIAVISSGYENDYGHPNDEVLERFAETDIETYWTGVHNHVVVRSDGERIFIDSSEAFSTDPLDLLEAKPDEEALASLNTPVEL